MGLPPRTGTVTVTVHVDDINDNAPDFTATYSTDISEDAVYRTPVFTVNVSAKSKCIDFYPQYLSENQNPMNSLPMKF